MHLSFSYTLKSNAKSLTVKTDIFTLVSCLVSYIVFNRDKVKMKRTKRILTSLPNCTGICQLLCALSALRALAILFYPSFHCHCHCTYLRCNVEQPHNRPTKESAAGTLLQTDIIQIFWVFLYVFGQDIGFLTYLYYGSSCPY